MLVKASKYDFGMKRGCLRKRGGDRGASGKWLLPEKKGKAWR